MNTNDIKRKNQILINYLQSLNLASGFKFKAEYSTNDNDTKVVVVQEVMGQKVVFYGDCPPLFNYYSIQIYSNFIAEAKSLAVDIGSLIGQSVRYPVTYTNPDDGKTYNELWQIIFQQLSNPQSIEYYDIRRVGYTATLKCIVNLVARTEATETE